MCASSTMSPDIIGVSLSFVFVVRAVTSVSRPSALATPAASLQFSRCRTTHARWGGAAGIRTPDLRRARAALSQTKLRPPSRTHTLPIPLEKGVGAPGLEPGTSALSGPRSNHLSYAPAHRPRLACPVPAHTARSPKETGPVPKTKQPRCMRPRRTRTHPLPPRRSAPAGPACTSNVRRTVPRLGAPGAGIVDDVLDRRDLSLERR